MLVSVRMDEHSATLQTSVIIMAFGEMKLKWSELNRVKYHLDLTIFI